MKNVVKLQHYYFHNCIYEQLYTDMRLNQKVSTLSVLHTLDADYKVILVGDAYRAPDELLHPGGQHDQPTRFQQVSVYPEPTSARDVTLMQTSRAEVGSVI